MALKLTKLKVPLPHPPHVPYALSNLRTPVNNNGYSCAFWKDAEMDGLYDESTHSGIQYYHPEYYGTTFIMDGDDIVGDR